MEDNIGSYRTRVFKKSDTFPDDLKKCNDNDNEAINISIQVKNIIKRMATEQGLYAQVVKLCQKDQKFISESKNKDEAKFKFQGQYSISKRWFDLDFDWIELKFSTCEPNFYKKRFQRHDDTQDTNTIKIFQVPIVNSKCVEKFMFHNDAPMPKYCQESLNSCCFISLVSVFLVFNKPRLPMLYHCAQKNP